MMRRDGCVGQLQVQSAQAAVPLGFICGSLPVPTVNPSSTPFSPTEAALVPAINLLSQRTGAPRYRLLPTDTDLNTAPSHRMPSDELLQVTASHDANGLCNPWEGDYLMQPLARKCESLAVSALAGYGDEIDVVAPVDILKQIFKTPYCKSRVSVAVHRIGHTLILNSGPDIEEGDKIVRGKKNQAKAMDRNLFSKFVQHSVHDDASEVPDSPKTCHSEGSIPPSTRRRSPARQPPGTVPPGFGPLKSWRVPWQVVDDSCSESASCYSEDDVRSGPSRGSKKGKQRVISRRNGCEGGLDFQKGNFIREQQQNSNFMAKDPDNPPRQTATENFLRVLFWQFQNLRMLLGSDLLLFSNEKHVAVSLHLMEIGRQVTPLMWLDAWLDNVMASIPELAVCYHRNGVVQGYELLKTDDIFLLKGLSEDGTAFFSPHVVQQNASSVLRFLQENCKQDPGTYWLFKNAGEDLMQLFDLSVISKARNTCGDTQDQKRGMLPPSRNRGNGHYSLPLAMLLYRLANRLSRSQDPADRMKCAKIFGKCLEYMDEQEHLVIRASAHEHAARLILACYKQLGVMLQPLLIEGNDDDTAVKDDAEQPVLELPPTDTTPGLLEEPAPEIIDHKLNIEDSSNIIPCVQDCQETSPENLANSADENAESFDDPTPTDLVLASPSTVGTSSFSHDRHEGAPDGQGETEGGLTVSDPVPQIIQALADPVSARLAAVHHLSQAIKSLRWQRQLQDVGENRASAERVGLRPNRYPNRFTECVCGEPECVAICDFRDIEVGFGMDEKLWQLLLLLGESYLTLGQAYKEDGQFSRALKAAELACLVRGSTPRPEKTINTTGGSNGANCTPSEVLKDKGLFWGQVWVLVGDVFAEIQRSMGESDVPTHLDASQGEELKMAQEVMKEVKRLKKKVGRFQVSCEICSLTSCSCQSDRASSGISASSSNSFSSEKSAGKYARKHGKKNNKSPPTPTDILGREKGTLSSEAYSKETSITSGANVVEPGLNGTVGEDSTHLDIFMYFKKPLLNDWEKNLSCASECYSCAVGAFADSIHLREYEGALRKKGWVCNELGRRRLAQGNVKSAEAAFETAIVAFRAVKDLPNIVLVYCNLAHGRRAAAEVFASQLSNWEECQLPHFYQAFVNTVAEARFLYQEALEFYGEGRRELMALGDGVERTMRGLYNEVFTQLAHTYLKLGMLLAREDKFLKAHRKTKGQKTVGDQVLPSDRKTGISAKEAISKALVLYESLGSLRAQEAAYAQFQLACQQRDSCLFALAMQAEELNTEKRDTKLHGAKRLASMADRYWQRALEYYRAASHPDMFLQILMERSSMCLAMAPSSQPNAMMEQALLHLLEGCRAVKFRVREDGEDTTPRVSSDVSAVFTSQLQRLLKTILGAALSASKPSGSAQTRSRKSDNGGRNEISGSTPKVSDVETLKRMYRAVLKLTGYDDINVLYDMWYS
ncbi:uncharacterized protein [Physcomitrium patens]|uniref:EDRF1 N-terminal domain-containing protein n=1 Tax=Physcomitrium patens TaxID=3218 RepID=A0A7I4F634_PHYPA|nr:uncharacterized protein LOC112292927 [Physcomitrium patens]XP_024397702.1 uncharacterized protein LOC112292927 [Physcomitrium patens]XP_024397703.1 uncharacterized protein LOC112292927 [Physcomitrium patens]|eukprot:XP_024397701.1 uncharacterized protein LOC112292927 [Physcomitrella patens]